MTAWNHPVIIFVGLFFGFAISWWLFRRGASPGAPQFECDVCGRRQRGLSAREWRFCPYCGVPRGERAKRRL